MTECSKMRAPRLLYQQRALSLVDEAVRSSGVEVAQRGRTFLRMTRTYVVLWNVGGLLRGADIEARDPLRFTVADDGEIIAARVVAASNDGDVSVRAGNADTVNAVRIIFDELGKGEGAVIEILHTSAERCGILAGARSGTRLDVRDRGLVRHPFHPLPSQVPASFKAVGSSAFVLIFGIGALLVLLSAFRPQLAIVFGPYVGPVMNVIEGLSDVIYAGLAFIVIAQTRRRFPDELAIPELLQ
jgi:hypothetical protein